MKKQTKKIVLSIPVLLFLVLACLYYLFPAATFNVLVSVERGVGGLARHRIDVNGIGIQYLEGGKGDVLVLLHGFGANKDNWTRIGRFLTPHFRVIAPDLPGFGESDLAPGGTYTVSAQADRVHAFTQAMGIKTFHLGGSSMGGNIAGVLASRHPDRIKSLWLLAPGGVFSSEPSEMLRMLEAGKPNPLVADSVEAYDRLLDFIFVKRPFIPYGIKKHLTQEAIDHQPLNLKIFTQLRSVSDQPPMEEMLKGLLVPTFIVWGTQDRVLHASGARILRSVIPAAAAEVMDDVGHLPMIEKPEETADLYLRFLKRK